MRSNLCAIYEMCNIRKYILRHYIPFKENKSNYPFREEKIIFHTKNLNKSINKTFTMQFD